MPSDITPDFATPRQNFAPAFPLVDRVDRALAPTESLMIGLTLSIGILCYALAYAFDQAVAWQAFLISFLPALGMIALGAYIRVARAMPRAAMAAIAAGIYIGFTGVITILIYLRFPLSVPMIDPQLTQIDALLFGYDWAAFTTALAAYPALGKFMGWVYGTSLLQLFAVIFVLAHLRQSDHLQRVMITGILSLLLTVAFWWAWPSVGPSAYTVLTPDVERALGLIHGAEAGARLLSMAEHGNAVISPQIIMGTIAFPSYHTVMLCLAVFFLWGTWAFWPMVLLNLGMLPAILAHGGHHASDLLGGVVAFALAAWIAARCVPRAGQDAP